MTWRLSSRVWCQALRVGVLVSSMSVVGPQSVTGDCAALMSCCRLREGGVVTPHVVASRKPSSDRV